MPIFDFVLVIIIGAFGFFGLWFGFVQTLGSLVGTVLGVFLATRYFGVGADWLMHFTSWNGNFSRVVMFIAAFIIINRLVGLVFWVLNKFLGIFTRLPFLNSLNRLLGLAFGLFEGVLVLGIIFYFIQRYPLSAYFMSMLSTSKIAPLTINVASILWPFIPQALTAVQNTVQTVVPK